MKYTLHQLEIFCKIAEKQSITKAAEELFMTQPAVSIQLKNLQNQFSNPLTEIIGRKLYLTEFGKVLAEKGNKIIDQVKDIEHLNSLYEGVLAGDLRISSASTGKYVIPYFLSEFSSAYSNVNIQLDVTNKTEVIKSLVNNEIDFAFISVIPDDIDINRVQLLDNHLYLVGPKGEAENIKMKTPKQLEKLRMLYRESGSATRQTMENYINKNKLTISSTIELTSNEAVKQSIIAGLGFSIMPLIGLRNAIQNNEMDIIPMKGLPIVTSWNVVWLKQKAMTPVMKAFVDYLQQNRQSIIDEKFSWVDEYLI